MTGEDNKSEAARWEGLGLGLGIAAGAGLCWWLPHVLDAGTGWLTAGRVAAWILFTFAAGASLIELETASGRRGFSDLGVAAVLVSVGAGSLALGAQVLSGVLGVIFVVLGVGLMVFGLAGAGLGVGRIASGRPRVKNNSEQTTNSDAASLAQSPGFSTGEAVAIVLAAAQVVLGAVALFR